MPGNSRALGDFLWQNDNQLQPSHCDTIPAWNTLRHLRDHLVAWDSVFLACDSFRANERQNDVRPRK